MDDRVRQRDRPPHPGTLEFGAPVLVRMPGGDEKRAVLAAAGTTTAHDAQGPKVFVYFGGNRPGYWVPRDSVRLLPPSRWVRARRWLSSFLFGEA